MKDARDMTAAERAEMERQTREIDASAKAATAEIIQFIPKPNPNRQRELEKEAAAILSVAGIPTTETVPFVETTGFTAPEKDSA